MKNSLKKIIAATASVAMFAAYSMNAVAADTPKASGGDSGVVKATVVRTAVAAAVATGTLSAVLLGVGTVLTPSKIGCGQGETCK